MYEGIIDPIIKSVPGVVAIYLYGSEVHKLKGAQSDIDLVVVCKELNAEILLRLRETRISTEKLLGKAIGISAHAYDDLLFHGKFYPDVFLHRNRSWLFIQEMREFSIRIWGEQIFERIALPEDHILFKESVRTLNSMCYDTSKKLLNKELTKENVSDLIKYGLYATKYFLFVTSGIRINNNDCLNYLIQHFPEYAETLNKLTIWKQEGYIFPKQDYVAITMETYGLLETLSKICNNTYKHLHSDKVWIVDGFGLLYHWNEDAYRLSFDSWLEKQLISVDRDDIQNNWRKIKRAAQADVMVLNNWRRNVFGDKLKDFEDFDKKWTLNHVEICPEVENLLRKLKQRSISIILLTDTIHNRQTITNILEKIGILDLIDGIIISNEIKAIKDDGRAFSHVKKYFTTTNSLFVGHSEKEIIAAIENGYFSIQVGTSGGSAEKRLPIASITQLLKTLELCK